jgi:uridine phosphorylase
MTDYFLTYQQFQSAYADLVTLIDTYPKDKAEEAGALGVWSPKQIIAHLSGWVLEATQRYRDIPQGNIPNKTYDDWDAFNAESVDSRAHLSWDETVVDFKQAVTTWCTEIENISAVMVAQDERFLEWLTAQNKEFRNHTNDLRAFIKDISASYPILEFDSEPMAVVEPSKIYAKHPEMPERVVICFFREVLMQLRMRHPMTIIQQLGGESGDNPIYRMMVDDTPVALLHPGVGAPLASAFMEEVIALGGRKFIACGGAGVLSSDIPVGGLIIPESAVRDEGTSYHYLPPSREVKGNPQAIKAIEETLTAHDIPYQVGKTWTTDGIYRETRKKVNARKAEGCLVVEMETASFFAVAKFRDVVFGQILYGGDDLGGEQWDGRNWMGQASTREKLFWLAAESVCKL